MTTLFPASTSTAQGENTNGTKSKGGKRTQVVKRSCGNKKGNSLRVASPAAVLAIDFIAALAARAVGPAASPTTTLAIIPTASFSIAPAAGPASVLTAGPAAAPVTTLAIILAVSLTAATTASFAFAPTAGRETALITRPDASPASFLALDAQEFSLRISGNSKGGIEQQEDHV